MACQASCVSPHCHCLSHEPCWGRRICTGGTWKDPEGRRGKIPGLQSAAPLPHRGFKWDPLVSLPKVPIPSFPSVGPLKPGQGLGDSTKLLKQEVNQQARWCRLPALTQGSAPGGDLCSELSSLCALQDPDRPGPFPEDVGAGRRSEPGAGGLLSAGDGRQPRAALKCSGLISDFKCLQSYSKSSRRKGSRPGTGKTSARLCWGGSPITSALCQALRDGEVSPPSSCSHCPLLLPAKGCLLQPKANLILSPDSSSLGCGPRSMPPTQDL